MKVLYCLHCSFVLFCLALAFLARRWTGNGWRTRFLASVETELFFIISYNSNGNLIVKSNLYRKKATSFTFKRIARAGLVDARSGSGSKQLFQHRSPHLENRDVSIE